MTKKNVLNPADYIVPLVMNGLQGRMLALPNKRRRRQILMVYGQHASLEQWWPLAQELNRYGNITMPDLPGFGGMQSFYKLGEKPSLDNLADYLAAFVKLRYKHKRVTIVGLAYGFMVVTRMLERSPDLAKKVDVLIGVGGFARYDDLRLSRTRRSIYFFGARLLAFRLPALFIRTICLRPGFVRMRLKRRGRSVSNSAVMQETRLWRQNDVRTHFMALANMLRVDNCRQQVNLPLWHITLSGSQYLDVHYIEQHLRIIFRDVSQVKSRLRSPMLGTVSYGRAALPLLPVQIHRVLAGKA